jgi:hypothetical protein
MVSNQVRTNTLLDRVSYRLNIARDRARRIKWRWRDLRDAGEPVEVNPTVALIVVGRNDNYGGDFRGRLNATLAWNLQFPFSEVIYVEWNPVADKPSDAEWLVQRFPNLRVYIVSRERHQRSCTNPKMPVMEYFAKNVGIRRAKADWICLVNADVLIGPDVFKRLAKLRPGSVYGTHNVNIKWTGSEIKRADLTEQLLGGFSAGDDLLSVVGNFFLAPRKLWHQARGYDESLTDRRVVCDGHGAAQLYNLGARPRVIGRHYHLDHPESCQNAVLGHQGTYFDPWEGVPYENSENWGQADAIERPVGERTWFLE